VGSPSGSRVGRNVTRSWHSARCLNTREHMSIFTTPRSRGVVVLAAAAVLAISAGSGAVAGSLITGKDIKDRTIEAQDLHQGAVTTNKVKNKTLKLKDLSAEVTTKLGTQGPKGDTGAQGPKGDTGAQGPKGESGTATYAGPNWSVIDRNVIGNGASYLRSGPTSNWSNTMVKPPMGVGSLGVRTGSAADKVAFGNEVDFQGKALASISSVSYWEYTTGENRSIGGANATPENLASVAFEINPNNGAQTYSTLNYVATAIPANAWTKITADQERWYLTGAAGTATGCNQTTYCTLAEVKAALPNATLFTVAITKGRDYAFTGAVDALQVGATTYDFEPFGVIEKTS